MRRQGSRFRRFLTRRERVVEESPEGRLYRVSVVCSGQTYEWRTAVPARFVGVTDIEDAVWLMTELALFSVVASLEEE